jgi:hypothetical protein
MQSGSDFLRMGFILLGVVLVAGFLYALLAAVRIDPGLRRRALISGVLVVAWVAVTGLLAARGVLRFDSVPPTMFAVIIVTLVGSILLARSPVGVGIARALPLGLLVGWQAFRLPLELLMHRAYSEGLMPVQMSYSGLNFDIATGASALLVAGLLAAGIGGRIMVLAWNAVGSLLLLNVVTIAILSTPTPLRLFPNEPTNVWIAQFPFVWLPVVMVSTAIIGHLLIFRKLRTRER